MPAVLLLHPQRWMQRLRHLRVHNQMMWLRRCVEAAHAAPRDALDAALPEVRMASARCRGRRDDGPSVVPPQTPAA